MSDVTYVSIFYVLNLWSFGHALSCILRYKLTKRTDQCPIKKKMGFYMAMKYNQRNILISFLKYRQGPTFLK